MPPKERHVDRGSRRARTIRRDLGTDLREARLAAGLTQKQLARAAGVSPSTISRIEAGGQTNLSIELAARLFAVVGMDLSVRAYPVGPPLRDAVHLALLAGFRTHLGPGWRWRAEVTVDRQGDLRAWDAVIDRPREGPGHAIAIEAETRLRDIQALLRRLAGKRRDSLVDRLILVVADTRGNRVALRAAASELDMAFPGDRDAALRALSEGALPEADAILLVRVVSAGRSTELTLPQALGGTPGSGPVATGMPGSGPVAIGIPDRLQSLNEPG